MKTSIIVSKDKNDIRTMPILAKNFTSDYNTEEILFYLKTVDLILLLEFIE